MIKYHLKCKNNHEFESWFSDSKEFGNLNKKKLLECIYCSSKKIHKSIMAPMISNSKSKNDEFEIINKDLKTVQSIQNHMDGSNSEYFNKIRKRSLN